MPTASDRFQSDFTVLIILIEFDVNLLIRYQRTEKANQNTRYYRDVNNRQQLALLGLENKGKRFKLLKLRILDERANRDGIR